MSNTPRLDPGQRERLARAGEACRCGRLAEAEELGGELQRSVPDHPAVVGLAGLISHLRGDLAGAVEQLSRALAMDPSDAGHRQNLALALLDAGRPGEAAGHLEAVLEAEPGNVHALALRAEALEAAGRPEEALAGWRELLRHDPEHPTAESRIVAVLGRLNASNPVVARELDRLLDSPQVESNLLAVSLAHALAARHGIAPAAREPALDDLAADDLLLRGLRGLYFTEPVFDAFLTRLRRRLLDQCRELGRIPRRWQPLIGALAVHNLRNEYVHAASQAEREAVDGLTGRLEQLLAEDNGPAAWTGVLLLVALYRSPATLEGAGRLAGLDESQWPGPARDLSRLAFAEPAREAALAENIPTLGEIEGRTSAAVRAMYEAHPYPRWDRLGPVVPGTVDERLRRVVPGFEPPGFARAEQVAVLIAGAGTGRHALRAAAEYTNARVLAVDISRRSLAYGARKAEELDLDNIEFLHADLFDLPKLERRFHLVETIGTLETLDDPAAGWALLGELLEPGGLLYAGSYSEVARRPVVRARERIRDEGLEGTADDMREFRRRVLQGELGADGRVLARCGDLYSLSGCRDFLFHVREKRFTIRELASLWKANGLGFLGFHPIRPPLREAYARRFPDDPFARDLDNWIAFEEGEPDEFCRLMNLSMLYYWLRKDEG